MIPRRVDFGILIPLLGMVLVLALLPGPTSGALAIATWMFTIGYVLGCIEPVKPLKAGKYPGLRITCAANRYRGSSDDPEVIILGVRHTDNFMRQQLHEVYGSPSNWPDLEEQGFVDQHGNFYSREEAYDIAHNAGQIIRRCGGDEGRLYSENLY